MFDSHRKPDRNFLSLSHVLLIDMYIKMMPKCSSNLLYFKILLTGTDRHIKLARNGYSEFLAIL